MPQITHLCVNLAFTYQKQTIHHLSHISGAGEKFEKWLLEKVEFVCEAKCQKALLSLCARSTRISQRKGQIRSSICNPPERANNARRIYKVTIHLRQRHARDTPFSCSNYFSETSHPRGMMTRPNTECSPRDMISNPVRQELSTARAGC